MENILEFNELYKKLDTVYKNINFEQLYDKIYNLTQENNNNIILINQLKDEINKKDLLLKEKESELKNYNKVSMIQNINKQLVEKQNYITTLENQIEKLKNSKLEIKIDSPINSKLGNSKNNVVENSENSKLDNSKNSIVENSENSKLKNSKNNMLENVFDPDNFTDINGYELIIYRRKYYLKDLETGEIYNIVNNMPSSVIGIILPNGKIKLN